MAGRFVLTPAVGFLTAIQNALNDMKVTDMQDADFTGLANGDVLVWNSGTAKWEAGTAGGGGVADGATLSTGLTFPNTGLHLLDTDASHDLIIKPDSNLTADRTLSVVTGDSNRTLTISGNADISGTNTGDQTTVSGNAGTATTLQTAREIDGISFDGSANIMVNNYLNILNALGGSAKSYHWNGVPISNAGSAITNQRLELVAVWLPKDATITGVNWIQATAGDYTANNYNGVGLYTYSGGTLTLVASSTDDGNIWKGTAQTYLSKAFSSTYNAAAGLYFIGALYCRSAAVTAPSIMNGNGVTASTAVVSQDFTNSAKLVGTVSSLTAFPATQAMSGVTLKVSSGFWLQLY